MSNIRCTDCGLQINPMANTHNCQPIGSTTSGFKVGGTGSNPTTQHAMDCAKLYGNLCSCGADHKTPTNNCGEKYCSRMHPIQPDTLNEKECNHWYRELMRNNQSEWYFYCQKCLFIKSQSI